MDRRIHSCLVIYRRVWEPDKKRVTHGLPYLVVEGQHFYQATQNRTWTARQSKMFILKSSRFWFYNIITHWGHPGKGVQKSNQNRNVEAKNRESNWTVIIAITWEFDCYNYCYTTTTGYVTLHYTTIPVSFSFQQEMLSGVVWTSIQYVILYFRDKHSAALLHYRNCTEITVLTKCTCICEQKPYAVWFLCWRKSYLVCMWCEHSLDS